MQSIKCVFNTKTGVEFDPNPNLIAYAKSDPESYRLVMHEVEGEEEPEVYTEDQLKGYSMKELQKIADDFEIECDRRRKDSLIDAILKHGR